MSPTTRIFLRYLMGYLILKNVLPEDIGRMISDDPDIAAMIEVGFGAVVAGATELWYGLARRYGWAK